MHRPSRLARRSRSISPRLPTDRSSRCSGARSRSSSSTGRRRRSRRHRRSTSQRCLIRSRTRHASNKAMISGWWSSASAHTSAASRLRTRANTAAGSARAMARCTTPRAASGRARRRRTCFCRLTSLSPTPRSRSAERNRIQGSIMSGHSTYQPQNKFLQWFEKRLPLGGLIHSSFVVYPVPRNLNYLWTFGGILAFMLGVQIVTGVVLAMHYTPHVDLAFKSVEGIMRDVHFGWLLRYLHANGASMFFLAVYIHMFRGIYYGSYKAPREILWILGVLLYALMILTAFLGYTLPWGQMSFWAATVITSLFSAIPVIGQPIVEWLWGGFGVDNPTLNRFFSLHYLLPFVLAGIVVLHIWALHVPGNNNPLGIDVKSPRDTVPFHPYYTVKDLFYLSCFLILFAGFVFFAPEALSSPDNAERANPLVTPPEIVPEWYFLPYYAILRSIPNKLMGVMALFGALGVLFFVPWLDSSKVRSARFRPVYKQFYWLFVADCVILGYVGAHPVDATLLNTSIPLLWIGRLAGLYYFAFFLVIMPIVGKLEKHNPLPDSIANSVLSSAPHRSETAP